MPLRLEQPIEDRLRNLMDAVSLEMWDSVKLHLGILRGQLQDIIGASSADPKKRSNRSAVMAAPHPLWNKALVLESELPAIQAACEPKDKDRTMGLLDSSLLRWSGLL
jgi:hypothetical protein